MMMHACASERVLPVARQGTCIYGLVRHKTLFLAIVINGT